MVGMYDEVGVLGVAAQRVTGARKGAPRVGNAGGAHHGIGQNRRSEIGQHGTGGATGRGRGAQAHRARGCHRAQHSLSLTLALSVTLSLK